MQRLTHNPLYIMLIVTTVGAVGQLLLKSGMSQVHKAPTLTGIVRIMLTEPRVMLGLLLYAFNTILYLRVLQEYPLSVVYPMIAISYVVVTLMAWFLLGEQIPLLRLMGLGAICFGVILLAVSARPTVTPPTDDSTQTALSAPSADTP